ncbi:relaxase/mobilization nuclease domain-containing protein [Agathobacter rectalis]|uniref:relaxase/mobilization nuclease domain-containing protein n=1 Tax=Agathobacter rectalis TaxID=39491 RepID=UPI0015701E9A|nr:relaxase/mobilization nuclease domain-containing protein [Agathobacter rectalis]NSI31748.1 relaxase/mobilization nuclease domain-containing protein [Agathobacter rectalis]NSI85209.1 relaxase/mobilization nuclease domain-containing protein [Agathobacter rectalis]
MAVTKTHPIKSTLKAAIDYILNPEKTDGKLLASSFGCGLETADIEFAWTREAAGDRGTHLGRHLIQSFAVGETTPEEAHKIGMELAGAVLGGKYEFVLTTHVDKDHLHNHLIFNAVSFVDYKKYHSNKQSYHFIRRTSDRICKEHGLSVVVPGQDKGKSYAEYTAEKQGTHDCTAHFIRTDLLTAGVLSNLRKVTSYAAKHEARFMKLLIEQNEDGGKRRNAAKKKELEASEKRIAELSAIFKRLYEDSVTGRISDERFTELSADYEAEQRELKERAAAIQAELSKAQEATVNAEKFMNVVRRHTSFEELTPTLLREFVEKIVVHECSYDENKTRRQDIEIYYSFVGKVDLPE